MSLKILRLSDSMTDSEFLSFCRTHKGYICCKALGDFIMQQTQDLAADKATRWKPRPGDLVFYLSLFPGIDRSAHDSNKPAIKAKLIAAFPEYADEIASWKTPF